MKDRKNEVMAIESINPHLVLYFLAHPWEAYAKPVALSVVHTPGVVRN